MWRAASQVVHDYWYQVSSDIGSVEALYEDDEFPHRPLAALVASKVWDVGRTAWVCWIQICTPSRSCALALWSELNQRFQNILQVFYHLGELDDALNYALGAESLFDVEEQSEYVQTLVGASQVTAMPRGCSHSVVSRDRFCPPEARA